MNNQADREETLADRYNAICIAANCLAADPPDGDTRYSDIVSMIENDKSPFWVSLATTYQSLKGAMEDAVTFIDDETTHADHRNLKATQHMQTISTAFGDWIDAIHSIADHFNMPFDTAEYALLTDATPSGALQSSDAATTGDNVALFDKSKQPGDGR